MRQRKAAPVGAVVTVLLLVACSAAPAVEVATPEPTPNLGAEYLEIAFIYNNAVDTWIGGDHGNLVWLNGFGRRMAEATREVSDRLVAWEIPENLDDIRDELIEAEAEAHLAFRYMANATSVEAANEHLVEALEGYASAAEYSQVIRVHLGLPSVEIDPFHYL